MRVLALLGVLAATEALLFFASFARPPLVFDVGPSTGHYLEGFTESWEYLPVTACFAGPRAWVDLPLHGASDRFTLTVRSSRLVESPASVQVSLSERPMGSFTAAPATLSLSEWSSGGRAGSPFGEFRSELLRADELPPGPLRLDLVVDDSMPSTYALAIDWIRIEGVRWIVPWSRYHPRLIVAGCLLLLIASGACLRFALTSALALGAALALWSAFSPFAMVHVTARVTWPALALGAAFAWSLRRRPRRAWVLTIFLAGYLVKGAGIFSPSYFYPDVRTHRRYLLAFDEIEGSFVQRGVYAQLRSGIGVRTLADERRPLPYSPLFYLPFTVLGDDPVAIDEAMKHAALVAAAAEVALVFWLAQWWLGPGAGILAALLTAALPPLFSRLLFAQWPTLVGHALDLAAIGAAVACARRPESLDRLAAFAWTSALALGSYVSGLFNVVGYAASLVLLERRAAVRVLAVALAVALGAVLGLYGWFTAGFFRDILPGFLRTDVALAGSLLHRLLAAMARVPLFFGYAYPALVVAGLLLLRRREDGTAFRSLAAYGLTFALLVGLRAFGGGLFRDLKEMVFAGPFVALTTEVTLTAIAARGRPGKLSATGITVGLVLFGLWKYGEYLAPKIAIAGL